VKDRKAETVAIAIMKVAVGAETREIAMTLGVAEFRRGRLRA
jgi:hypothetical protein